GLGGVGVQAGGWGGAGRHGGRPAELFGGRRGADPVRNAAARADGGIFMKRCDREYTALIHKLAHCHTGTLLELMAPIYWRRGKIADEDLRSHLNEIVQVLSAIFTTPPMNEIRQELRAAGIE